MLSATLFALTLISSVSFVQADDFQSSAPHRTAVKRLADPQVCLQTCSDKVIQQTVKLNELENSSSATNTLKLLTSSTDVMSIQPGFVTCDKILAEFSHKDEVGQDSTDRYTVSFNGNTCEIHWTHKFSTDRN